MRADIDGIYWCLTVVFGLDSDVCMVLSGMGD